MRRTLLLLSLLILSGCAAILPDPFPEGTATWDIPVQAAKIENVEAPGVLPSDEPQTEMVIVVPPSDKPTHIKVEKRHVSLKKKLLSNEPEHKVISDSQGVTAAQPKKTLWWRWLVVIIVVLFVVCVVVMWIMNRISRWSPMGFIKKLLRISVVLLVLAPVAHAEDWQAWARQKKIEALREQKAQHEKTCQDLRIRVDDALSDLKTTWDRYGVSPITSGKAREARKVMRQTIQICSDQDMAELYVIVGDLIDFVGLLPGSEN